MKLNVSWYETLIHDDLDNALIITKERRGLLEYLIPISVEIGVKREMVYVL